MIDKNGVFTLAVLVALSGCAGSNRNEAPRASDIQKTNFPTYLNPYITKEILGLEETHDHYVFQFSSKSINRITQKIHIYVDNYPHIFNIPSCQTLKFKSELEKTLQTDTVRPIWKINDLEDCAGQMAIVQNDDGSISFHVNKEIVLMTAFRQIASVNQRPVMVPIISRYFDSGGVKVNSSSDSIFYLVESKNDGP